MAFFKKLFIKPLWITLTSVFAGLFAVLLTGTLVITNFAYAAVNMAFGTSNIKQVNDPNAELSVFYKSDRYETKADYSAEELFEEDKKVIEQVELEGATLLWNKEHTLPLAGNEKVSCLSHSSVSLVESGSGSGWVDAVSIEDTKTKNSVTMKDALTDRGFTVNDTLWNFYTTGAGKNYTRTEPNASCTEGQTWAVHEVPWSVYTDPVKASFSEFDDLAIVVLSRSGGEYSDLHYSSTENKNGGNNGNYLALTQQEKDLLSNVASYRNAGTFKKVLLLLNTANPLDMQDIEPYFENIDACMWIGQPGTVGINAVVDLLKGEDKAGNQVSPSGRLTDTYAYDNESAPATENDGDYMYAGDCSGLNETQFNRWRQRMYMVYQEGIYVGYKYYETRYEDCIEGEGDASSAVGKKNSESGWNYDEEVAFPFGFGLSYTDFTYSNFKYDFDKKTKEHIVSVDVKNTGNHAGKETVQLYLQKPFTPYDKNNDIEKASVELVGYGKTPLLAVGSEPYTVTITVPQEYLKTYDANKAGTYIFEDGEYFFTIASDSHEAINNILEKKGKSGLTRKAFGQTLQSRTGKNFAELVNIQEKDLRRFSKSTQTGYDIVNQFDSGDWNKYQYATAGEGYSYLSRQNWSGTYPSTPTLSMNEGLKSDLAYDRPYEETETELPTYDTVKGEKRQASKDAGDVVAFEFIDAPLYPDKVDTQDTYTLDGKVVTYAEYWNTMWERLMNQMTFEEQALICANAYHRLNGATSIALGETKQENGPVGITKRTEAIFAVPAQRSTKTKDELEAMGEYNREQLIDNYYWVAYPCAPIVAATFNNELIENMGKSKGEDMLWLGYNGIYGPGVNMHRSPFGGRNFEYPSEDSVLAGYVGFYESKGIESKGCLAYAKHYALNDMETNRRHVGIWSSEQATREIYLRPFEMTFAKGGARATMNSFTRIGARWNGASKEMMTTVLREEWGFEGIVISDWDTNGTMSKLDGILAGTDSFDGNNTESAFARYKNSPTVAHAIRESARRIIYNVVKTNAMNGTSITTKYESVTPWWEQTLWALTIVFGVLGGISAAMLVLSFTVFNNKKKPAAEAVGTGGKVEYIEDSEPAASETATETATSSGEPETAEKPSGPEPSPEPPAADPPKDEEE